jgi:hypothetical protein
MSGKLETKHKSLLSSTILHQHGKAKKAIEINQGMELWLRFEPCTSMVHIKRYDNLLDQMRLSINVITAQSHIACQHTIRY